MRCPYCKKDNDRVIDTRTSDDGSVIRRRRVCHCGRRFTTHERLEELPLRVVKKNGQRQPFRREKVLAGVQRAIGKRDIPAERAEALVDEVERELLDLGGREVASRTIGELVTAKMRALDDVAYVRFASVYREFQAVDEFVKEIQTIHSETTHAAPPPPRPYHWPDDDEPTI